MKSLEKTTSLSEQDLLAKVVGGDMTAFAQLFEAYQPKLVRFLVGFTHDSEESLDMAQDIFATLWSQRTMLVNVHNFSAYLFKMARYVVYNYFDHLAVKERYATEQLLCESGAQDEEEALFARELQTLIDNTVEQMSPQRRQVYKMSREQGISNDEIAVRLGISKRTVENHLSAALSILRRVVCVVVMTKLF